MVFNDFDVVVDLVPDLVISSIQDGLGEQQYEAVEIEQCDQNAGTGF